MKTKVVANVYKDMKLQAAYENACDCLYYGCGWDVWNRYDIDDDTARRIWKTAKNNLANGRRY